MEKCQLINIYKCFSSNRVFSFSTSLYSHLGHCDMHELDVVLVLNRCYFACVVYAVQYAENYAHTHSLTYT